MCRYSTNASSRVLRNVGSTIRAMTNAVRTSKIAEIGRWKQSTRAESQNDRHRGGDHDCRGSRGASRRPPGQRRRAKHEYADAHRQPADLNAGGVALHNSLRVAHEHIGGVVVGGVDQPELPRRADCGFPIPAPPRAGPRPIRAPSPRPANRRSATAARRPGRPASAAGGPPAGKTICSRRRSSAS